MKQKSSRETPNRISLQFSLHSLRPILFLGPGVSGGVACGGPRGAQGRWREEREGGEAFSLTRCRCRGQKLSRLRVLFQCVLGGGEGLACLRNPNLLPPPPNVQAQRPNPRSPFVFAFILPTPPYVETLRFKIPIYHKLIEVEDSFLRPPTTLSHRELPLPPLISP